MVSVRCRWLFMGSALIVPLAAVGCGSAPSPGRAESLTKEATVDGMACVLNIKSQQDPELNWAVTDRVVADFSGHHVQVDKKQVTLDGKSKPVPKGTQNVTIDFENNAVTIRAGGKPLFGPGTR